MVQWQKTPSWSERVQRVDVSILGSISKSACSMVEWFIFFCPRNVVLKSRPETNRHAKHSLAA